MSDPEATALPEIIPIFPLTGVLLLPRGRLPLNIFEPRYLAMTRDAMAGERLIGMVQPSDPPIREMNPAVYPLGCAGRITSFAETDDGRFLITLTGVSRFSIKDELPLVSGYRRIVAAWGAFAADGAPDEAEFDRARLIRGLRHFFSQRQVEADWSAIEQAPGEHLVTSIAMMCPFAPSEKQALLEAKDVAERARLLIALIEMTAVAPPPAQPGPATRH
ncbi:MAG: LON peptidase substrate-binding domain-containing protein [Alphaproteobacteria bacterium]|nr:LON peptidase substrate-binding domain-containing protein [Alphaproteobacteria bacterium]